MSISNIKMNVRTQATLPLLGFCLAFLFLGSATAANTSAAKKAQTQPAQQTSSSNPYNSNFQENALKRCKIFSGEERSLCERNIMDGPVSGSVTNGGVSYGTIVKDVTAVEEVSIPQ